MLVFKWQESRFKSISVDRARVLGGRVEIQFPGAVDWYVLAHGFSCANGWWWAACLPSECVPELFDSLDISVCL